ncbi:MAG: hypothetical protein DRI89_10735 [Bacteroidetes bacterium]|nr:MAG: hypothetical protein DRI89_10735 [Bacteroidota bacterium]
MRTIFISLLILFVCSLFAQQTQEIEPDYQLRALSISEELQLKNLPVIKMTTASRSRDLPFMVDNSTQIYMRPVFNQAGYSCGQASSVAYNFTYEMARARNVAANTTDNQYTTHFTWNWMNAGIGYFGRGVSYLHSFQVLKYVGEPDVATYGGLSSGGEKRWLSDYDDYYTAMGNRITEAYQIPCGTAEELITLKHWLNDHLDGSDVGGVASYYAQYMSANYQLPAGTPEAGKYVLTSYGGSANHAMTIVGYNDSIRWDYNNDGQYTNNIDINGDGELNMKDWEIGGFKMVQSYGGVPNWGDQGYAYMMYKTVADDLGQGGIWNHCVHVLDVKESYEPKLTAQVTLTHNKRRQIKVLAGLSNNGDSPDFIIDFPIFDYQGGAIFMQGGTSESDKTIEIGLDLSPLLTEVTLDQNVQLFLMVVENDPDGNGTGSINSFSIWDYTNGAVNVACSQNNVPLQNNDTTSLSITHNFDFDRVEIQDETLPPAPQGIPYAHQMTASGGTVPYIWEFDKTYETLSTSQPYPPVTGQQLYPSNNDYGKISQLIDFDFPFYDSSYSSISAHVDGYLMFDDQLYPYPYFHDDKVLFEVSRNISPFNTQFQYIRTANSDGMWYEGDSTYATFWWKTTYVSDNNTSYNYAVTLYPNGEIKYNYGSINGLTYLNCWIAGVSDGDTKNFEVLEISHDQSLSPNQRFNFTRYDYPPEFEISDDGLFSGIPQQAYSGTEISFKVSDNNHICSTKTLLLSSSGIIVQNSVESGDNDIIEYGETASISIVVTSVENDAIENVSMEISIQDEYITLTDSTEYIGTLFPGIAVSKPDAFHFNVSSEIPNNHPITFNTTLITPDTSYPGSFIYTGFAPIVIVANVLVSDENNRLDPGDTTDIVLSFQNMGGAVVKNVLAVLNSEDPDIIINNYEGTIPLLEAGETGEVTYNITVAEEAENGHLANFDVEIYGDNNYETTDTFELVIGFNAEDFETGDLHFINWGFDGDKDWQIDLNTRYEGAFSARSGYISHMQESVMILDMEILSSGDISFFKKVSCEDDENNDNFDYLAFSIDGIEQERWDGDQDWTLETYSVESGFHRFAWVYHKDTTASSLMDAAWIDYITFPSGNDAPPFCSFNPELFEVTMKPGVIYSDTLWITNTGQRNLKMELYVKQETPQNSEGRSIFGSYLSCSEDMLRNGHEYPMTFTLYNAGMDNEWIRDLYIDFPVGMELTDAGSFVGGSGGDMLHDGTFGDGITAQWHGEDSVGWGVVKGGQTAVSEIMVYIHDELVENASLNFEIHGENYADPPHIIIGSMPIRNLGPEIPWFSIDTNYAEIQGGESFPFVVTYNTDGLEDGNYSCEILSLNNFQQEVIIPVNLTVDHLVGMDNGIKQSNLMLVVYPNPLQNMAFISYYLSGEKKVLLEIFDLHGKLVSSLSRNQIQTKGKHLVNWDATTEKGKQLPSGIYFCKLKAGYATEIVKIVVTK